MKKLLSVLLIMVLAIGIVGCNAKAEEATTSDEGLQSSQEASKGYKIGIVTPTLSTSEDEYRGAENMVKKYPGIVKHITLPENFATEVETGLSQITSLADDPEMKAIIVVSGQSGLLPAMQKIEEKRPDIITMTAPIWDDPELMSKYIDVCIDTDWVRRGQSIAQKAHDMGAKTIIHYSFPTHMAKEVIVARRDMMKETAEKLGMTFVEISTPDPQTGNGPSAMQQFLREDIPRQIEKYGADTNIFGTNCPMYDVIIDEALKLKFIVAEQCCPTPTQAYPTVMNLEISEEDAGDFDKINQMICEKAAEADMTGRLSGWPVPVTVYVPEFAVELAKKMIEDETFDYKDLDALDNFSRETFGVGAEFNRLKPEMDNYLVLIMESIFY